MMKKETVKKKVDKIKYTLDKMERGQYSGLPLSWVTNTISWLWKYRYISEEEMNELADRAIYIMKEGVEYDY